jgi:glycerol-3-phosphate O-acyltransferase
MSIDPPKPGLLASLHLRWLMLLQNILHWWVRSRSLPDPMSDLHLDPAKPVCYAIDTYALTSILILDRACRDLNLPRPLLPLPLIRGN